MSNHYLSVEEIASLTSLSKQFFYSEIYKSRVFGTGIPYKKFGPRVVRFNPEEVLAWLETRKQDFRTLREAVELSKNGKSTEVVGD